MVAAETGTVSAMDAYISQASDINGQLILLIFISAILGLGKGGVPGFATVATALTVATAPMAIKGGLGYAVSLQVPILAMIDISAAHLHRASIDWDTTLLLLPFSFVGMAIGSILDRYMTDALGRVLVGGILLSILTLKVWDDVVAFIIPKKAKMGDDAKAERDSSHEDIEESPSSEQVKLVNPEPSEKSVHTETTSLAKNYGWACVVGLIGGAATMLTNSMGPILNVYLLSVRKLNPTQYIGTRAMFFCFLNIGKLPIRFYSGALGLEMIPLALGLSSVAVIGVFCAKPIMLSMNEKTFVVLELGVVAFAGVRLMWMGLTM